MIQLRKTGFYSLIETKNHIKILYLDERTFAWIEPAVGWEMLVMSHNAHKTDCVLSIGRYQLYDVDDEPLLSDQMHLELEVGDNSWQGYLLLSGLPSTQKNKARIIPTAEVITVDAGQQGYGLPPRELAKSKQAHKIVNKGE